MAVGAAAGGVLILTAPAILPALPLATLSVVIATATYHHTQQTGTGRSHP